MRLRNWRDAGRATGRTPMEIAQAVLDGRIPKPKKVLTWTEQEFLEVVATLKEEKHE